MNSGQSVLPDTETSVCTEHKMQPQCIFYVTTMKDPHPLTKVGMLQQRNKELQRKGSYGRENPWYWCHQEQWQSLFVLYKLDQLSCLQGTGDSVCWRLHYRWGSETLKYQHFRNTMSKKTGPQRKLTSSLVLSDWSLEVQQQTCGSMWVVMHHAWRSMWVVMHYVCIRSSQQSASETFSHGSCLGLPIPGKQN